MKRNSPSEIKGTKFGAYSFRKKMALSRGLLFGKSLSLTNSGLLSSKLISRNRYKWPKLAHPVNPAPNEHIPFKVPTLDDIPIPTETFEDYYKRKNKKYNLHLLLGIVMIILPISYMYIYEPIFWNASYPPLPPKEERIKSFWSPKDDDED